MASPKSPSNRSANSRRRDRCGSDSAHVMPGSFRDVYNACHQYLMENEPGYAKEREFFTTKGRAA